MIKMNRDVLLFFWWKKDGNQWYLSSWFISLMSFVCQARVMCIYVFEYTMVHVCFQALICWVVEPMCHSSKCCLWICHEHDQQAEVQNISSLKVNYTLLHLYHVSNFCIPLLSLTFLFPPPTFNIAPEKMVVGRQSFPIWDSVTFQGQAVNLQEGKT